MFDIRSLNQSTCMLKRRSCNGSVQLIVLYSQYIGNVISHDGNMFSVLFTSL